MYTQNMATFDFTEEVTALGDFLSSADLYQPIALRTDSKINPVNLVTTLAHTQQRNLIVLRADPSFQHHKFSTSVFNLRLTEKINSQLLDYATVRHEIRSKIDRRAAAEAAIVRIDEKEVIPKQLWMQSRSKDVNLDEGRIFYADESATNDQKNPHMQQILEAAREGSWVMLVPVQFPHYFARLLERLEEMK